MFKCHIQSLKYRCMYTLWVTTKTLQSANRTHVWKWKNKNFLSLHEIRFQELRSLLFLHWVRFWLWLAYVSYSRFLYYFHTSTHVGMDTSFYRRSYIVVRLYPLTFFFWDSIIPNCDTVSGQFVDSAIFDDGNLARSAIFIELQQNWSVSFNWVCEALCSEFVPSSGQLESPPYLQ